MATALDLLNPESATSRVLESCWGTTAAVRRWRPGWVVGAEPGPQSREPQLQPVVEVSHAGQAAPKMGPREGQGPSRIKAVNRGRADVGRASSGPREHAVCWRAPRLTTCSFLRRPT